MTKTKDEALKEQVKYFKKIMDDNEAYLLWIEKKAKREVLDKLELKMKTRAVCWETVIAEERKCLGE